jgi:creatinine amidohydrolase
MMAEQWFLEHMTWPDIEAALAAGRTRVVVGVGAVEQHGPHLPLCTDAERGTRLAYEVARRLDDALVAPTIRVGCSEHHMAFPGTLTVRPSTLEAVCTDYCTSLARHGFRVICLVPSHGGNFAPLAAMLDRLNAAVAPEARVLLFADLLGFVQLWQQTVEAETGLGARVGGHADIAETSEMLAVRPELVHTDRAAVGYTEPVNAERLERLIREGFRTATPNGIIGDARGADAATGEACIAAAADAIAEALRAEM